jgi:two-component system cell cycle sensor histidine kinase/response regulator CckA
MERRALLQASGVFVAALVAGAWVDARLAGLETEERRRAAADLAHASARTLEREFERSLGSAAALAAMVEEGASDEELAGVAKRLLQLDGGILNLQLARDYVISHLWPLAGNDAAYGLDLLRSERHGAYTRRVIETRAPLMYGPFELVQGGAGLAVRVPVRTPGDAERLWGLSSAVLRVRDLVSGSRLNALGEAGFEWELAREGPAGRREHVAPEGAPPLADAVWVPVALPGQTWSLGLAPRGGWRDPRGLTGRQTTVLLVALLGGLLAYRVLSLPAILRREVEARTAELEVAHREQRRAEEAQRQSQKLEAIGLLAGGVAHDFNNLLVGILGYADVLAEEAAPGSVQAEAARTISQAAQRAAALTRQLLAVARLGRHPQQPVDLHEVVREVAALLERTLDKSIRLGVRLDAAGHSVRGDASQLQQVILNLAVNARDAMPEGGTLEIATAEDAGGGRRVLLVVSDTGVGIPKEHLERIFEPFFTTKDEGHGTGLGLATAYGIVKAHGGTLRVASDVGVGSRFTVSLPTCEGACGEPAETPQPSVRGRGVVLVVDDEEVVRTTAGQMLASLGFEPALVAGGREALEWLDRSPPPTAILLDMAMPGMDGRACFREMRARHPTLRVVLSSGFTRSVRVEELLAEGAVAFVEKPYRTADLARALALGTGSA